MFPSVVLCPGNMTATTQTMDPRGRSALVHLTESFQLIVPLLGFLREALAEEANASIAEELVFLCHVCYARIETFQY